jgi:hypothetical protein
MLAALLAWPLSNRQGTGGGNVLCRLPAAVDSAWTVVATIYCVSFYQYGNLLLLACGYSCLVWLSGSVEFNDSARDHVHF